MIDSVIGENIPIFTEQEKFNETVTSSVKRLESALTGVSVLPALQLQSLADSKHSVVTCDMTICVVRCKACCVCVVSS